MNIKKSAFILVTFLFIHQTNAQVLISLLLGDKLNSDKVEFGLEGGANFSHITSLQSSKFIPNYNLGFYFDIRIKNAWHLSTGVLVKSTLGTNKLSVSDLEQLHAATYNVSGTYSQKINYFLVPVLAKYQFKNRVYLEAGPQAGLMNNAWIEFNADSNHTTTKIKEKNVSSIHRIDFGLVGGLGYKFQKTQGVTIGIKYYYGLLDVYKDVSGSRNSSLFIKLNIPIGAGKKKTPAAE